MLSLLLRLLLLMVGSAALFACGGSLTHDGGVIRRDSSTISDTVAVIDHSPSTSQKEVDPMAAISIDFSGPIDVNRVGFDRVQVRTRSGRVLVDGDYDWNSEKTRVTFTPEVYGQRAAFDLDTQYEVILHDLNDDRGYLIPDYLFRFRTRKSRTTDQGGLEILEIRPKSFFVRPSSIVQVRFSEPVYTGAQGERCSTTRWSNAFRVVNIRTIDEINLSQILGRVCAVRDPVDSSKGYTTLEFEPYQIFSNGDRERGWPNQSWFTLMIRDTQSLRGISGARLSKNEDIHKFAQNLIPENVNFQDIRDIGDLVNIEF